MQKYLITNERNNKICDFIPLADEFAMEVARWLNVGHELH